MRKSANGRFVVWDLVTDPYDYTDLLSNFDAIDRILGNPGDGTGLPGLSVARKSDITGVASSWLGPGDSTIIASGASGDAGSARNLYSVVKGLISNDVPLGTVISWWRPTSLVGVPQGWAVCDGSSLTAANHSWSGMGTIVLPDLRNKFVLGASTSITDGTASVAGDGAANAPGIGYSSSVAVPLSAKNAKRDLTHTHASGTLSVNAHTHDMASHTHLVTGHNHTITAHTHDMQHVHVIPDHFHTIEQPTFRANDSAQHVPHGGAAHVQLSLPSNFNNAAVDVTVSTDGHAHDTLIQSDEAQGTGNKYGASSNFWDVGNSSGYFAGTGYFNKDDALTSYPMIKRNLAVVGGQYDLKNTTGSSGVLTTSTTTGTPTGAPNTNITGSAAPGINGTSSNPSYSVTNDVNGSNLIDVRPAHVGLLYIMKVKKSFNIIDNDRVLFDSSIT